MHIFIGLPQILFPQIIVFSRDIIIFLCVVRTLSLFSIIFTHDQADISVIFLIKQK